MVVIEVLVLFVTDMHFYCKVSWCHVFDVPFFVEEVLNVGQIADCKVEDKRHNDTQEDNHYRGLLCKYDIGVIQVALDLDVVLGVFVIAFWSCIVWYIVVSLI